MGRTPPLVRALVVFVALGAVAQSARAQGSTFPRGGLRSVSWGPGRTLELGSTAGGSAAIALRFRYDPVHAIALSTIGHRGTRADGTVTLFDYSAEAPVGGSPALFEATLRQVGGGNTAVISSVDASAFLLWVDAPAAPRRALLRWEGVVLPDPQAESSFWTEMMVEVDPARPSRVTWQTRMGRQQRPNSPNRYTIDEVQAPILHVKAPWVGALERLLVPIAASTPVPAENLPLAVWEAFHFDLAFEHPARDQQMQFSALYSGTPLESPAGNAVRSSFRKILYMSTEDRDGYYKQFRHRVVRDGATLAYRWAPVFFPVYGASPSVNTLDSPYPAVLEAIEARSDSFWFDCAATYRRFVDQRMGLTRISDRRYALNPDFPRASPFVATSVIQDVATTPLPQIYPLFTDHALRLRKVFDGADGRPLPTFMEWQKWLKGDPTSSPYARRFEDPIGPDFNPRPYSGAAEAYQEPPSYVRAEIARAHANGINVSVYTAPVIMNRNDWPSFDDNWFLRDRSGGYIAMNPQATGRIVDYGTSGVSRWMADNLYDDIMNAVPDLGGVFFDVLSGAGSNLRFPGGSQYLFRVRSYNGGTTFVDGTRDLFDRVRSRIAQNKSTRRHPDIPFIPSETVQEYLAGRFDFGQQGLKAVPMQMQLITLFDTFFNIPLLSSEASNPSPPLWNAVYHEWSRAEGLTVPLTVQAVQGPLGGGQTTPPFPGVNWSMWGDYMRMVHALWWFQGMKPTSFQYLHGLEPYDLLVDDGQGGVTVRDPSVPQEQQLVDFLRLLHHSLDRFDEAGKFLVAGRMERPLQTRDEFAPTSPISRSLNPAWILDVLCDPRKPGVFHFYENPFSKFIYDVPHVFHAVWRSVETGELGVVFVNWSDQAATWEGRFDPASYDGFAAGRFTVRGVTPAGIGTTEYLVGQGSGPTTLAWLPSTGGMALRHHAAATPGPMPPRSVQVFVIRPN